MAKGYQGFLRSMQGNVESSEENMGALRPTLYIGLGGFGNAVLQKVKKFIIENIPDYADGYGFIGLDTYQLDPIGNLTPNQYVPLSFGVTPNVVAKQNPQFLNWYPKVAGYYKAKSIQSGADACKAVGRLAFRFPPTLGTYVSRLDSSAQFLMRPRRGFVTGEPVKVFVISTIAGGTGAGCLLDVLFVTGKFLRDTVGAEFPYQAILVGPEMLKTTPAVGRMDEFCANSFATLSELHHFLATGDEMVLSYDDRRLKNISLNSEYLPNHVYFVGTQNEEGNTIIGSPDDMQDVVVSYLVSEIQTPKIQGSPRIQDKENVYFGTKGTDGTPRLFSSFGVVRAGYPSDVAESLYAYRLLRAVLGFELAAQDHTATLGDADNWLTANRLKEEGSDQLQDLIKGYIQGDYQVRLDAVGSLMQPGFKYEKLVIDCQNFIKEKRKVVEGDRKKAVESAAKTVIESVTKSFVGKIGDVKSQSTIGEALQYLKIMQNLIKGQQNALRNELKQAVSKLDIFEKEVDTSIRRVGESIKGWWGRKGRVNDIVSDFGLRVQGALNQQIDVWIKEKTDEAYSVLIEKTSTLEKELAAIVGTVTGRLADANRKIVEISATLNKMSKIESRGEGNRFSLVNSDMVNQFYDELLKPGESAAVSDLRKNWLETGQLSDTKLKFDQWIDAVAPSLYDRVKERLGTINFLSVLERFFGEENKRRNLFKNLGVISAPLFWLDPNVKQQSYDLFWIIGIHPDLKRDFISGYENYLGGLGYSYAYFDTKDEIILYQLKIGYTIRSLRSLNGYEMDFRLKMTEFMKGLAEKEQLKPVLGWPEAEMWTDFIRRPEAEEALKWFALGRAFNFLYPTEGSPSWSDRKNVSFIFARGSNYYMQVREGGDNELIGKGLGQAVANFSERKDWQDSIRQRIEAKIKAAGEDNVVGKLQAEYLPALNGEVEATENQPDAQMRERREILIKSRSAINEFMQ